MLPQGIEAEAGQHPTTDRPRRPGRVGGQVSPAHGHRLFWQGPGHEPRPDRGFHTGGGGTPDVMELEQRFHSLTHEFHGPACPIQAQDVAQRPRSGGQRGDESHPRRQASRRRARRPPLRLGLVPHPSPGDGRGRGRELSGQQPDGIALVLPGAPPMPCPRGRAWRLQPWHDLEGLPRHRVQREGGGCAPQHTVRLRVGRAGDARTVASAVVGDREVTGLQGNGRQTFAPVPIRHTDLGEPARGAVIRHRQPPVVPRAARLPERARLHAQHTAPRAGGLRGDRPWGGPQGAQAPEPPGMTGPQPFAPGGLCEIREPDQHGPSAETPGRQGA